MKSKNHVVVIGAGIVGISIAYHLVKFGFRVCVINRGLPGTGASGDNLGQLSIMDRDEPMELAWSKESLSLYQEISEIEGVETELFQSGGMLLFGSEEQKQLGIELKRRQIQRGVPVELIDGNEISSIEPYFSHPDVVGGLHCGWEGSVMPLKVVAGLAEATARHGGVFFYRNRVIGFTLNHGKLKAVRTEKETIEADYFVLATGSWTRDLCTYLDLDVPVHYHKGTALVTVPVPRYIRTVIVSGGFLLNRPIRNRVVGLGVAQHLNGSIIIGQASEPGFDYNRNLSIEGVYETIKNFLKYFPELRWLEFIRAWAGNTTYTDDGFPVYGFSEKVPNLFLAAGLKGAFSTALGAGKMAAQLIEGKYDSTSTDRIEEVLKRWDLCVSDLKTMCPERREQLYGQSHKL